MRFRRGLEDDELPGRTISSRLWEGGDTVLYHVRGEYEPFPWTATSMTETWALVLPMCGMYRRRYDGLEHIVDVNTGFVRRPGEETALEMPTVEPDELTILRVGDVALDGIAGLPEARGPLRITPALDLTHRLLRRRLAVGDDDFGVEVAVADVLNVAFDGSTTGPSFVRASTEVAHRRLVADTCELLHVTDPALTLSQLARALAVSPFHLTKVFRRVTGETISQYRSRLRVHRVLDRVSAGEANLSAVAAWAGFADHSHMTRTVVAHVGYTPSALRELLGRSA